MAAICSDVAPISCSLGAGIPCKAPGEMKMGKGWLLVLITEHMPALCSAEIGHHWHCGAPAPLNKIKFLDFSELLQSGTSCCLVNGNFVSHAY